MSKPPPFKRLRNPARRPVRPNILRLKNRCLTVLTREVNRMMDQSFVERLSAADGKQLIEYLKYTTEMAAVEELEKLEKKKK